MSLESRILAFAQAVASDIKSILTDKQDKLVSGQNLKTVNGQSLLGDGDVSAASGSTAGIDRVARAMSFLG